MTPKTWIDNGCLQPVVVFAGQNVGIREVADKIWLVSFIDYDLGFFDEDENKEIGFRSRFSDQDSK